MTRHLAQVLAFGLVLAIGTPSEADPLVVTSGVIGLSSPGLIPNPFFRLDGAGFHFENSLNSGNLDWLQPSVDWAVACSSSAAGQISPYRCQAGDIVDLSFSLTGEGPGSGSLDGRQYSQLWYRGTFSVVASPVTFQPDLSFPVRSSTVSAPFAFTAQLQAFEGDREVFVRTLTGGGLASMLYEYDGGVQFMPGGDGDNGPFYEFAAVPEPSTMVLVTFGLISALRFRRRPRDGCLNQESPRNVA